MSAAGSKRDLRGRLSDMFSRKGQMSRGNRYAIVEPHNNFNMTSRICGLPQVCIVNLTSESH